MPDAERNGTDLPDDAPEDTKFDRLQRALDFQAKYYRGGANFNRRWALRLKFLLIFLAFVTTVLLGYEWSTESAPTAKQAAFVISALVTALTSLEGLYDYSGNWIRRRAVYLRIIQLRAKFNFAFAAPGPEDPDAKVEEFWEEFQRILEEDYTQRIEALAESASSSSE